jgi:hypothetical protein
MRYTPVPSGAVVLAAALLAGCAVDVRDNQGGSNADVDIRSPLGNVSVRTDVDEAATGLPVYPNARPLRSSREPENAIVRVGSSFFGVDVVAAKFESGDAPGRVVDYYREQLTAYGSVVECRGEIDFRRGEPRCRPRSRGDEVQLVAGTEERHRLVSVKPRGAGSEFAVVYIRASGGDDSP